MSVSKPSELAVYTSSTRLFKFTRSTLHRMDEFARLLKRLEPAEGVTITGLTADTIERKFRELPQGDDMFHILRKMHRTGSKVDTPELMLEMIVHAVHEIMYNGVFDDKAFVSDFVREQLFEIMYKVHEKNDIPECIQFFVQMYLAGHAELKKRVKIEEAKEMEFQEHMAKRDLIKKNYVPPTPAQRKQALLTRIKKREEPIQDLIMDFDWWNTTENGARYRSSTSYMYMGQSEKLKRLQEIQTSLEGPPETKALMSVLTSILMILLFLFSIYKRGWNRRTTKKKTLEELRMAPRPVIENASAIVPI